MSGSGVSPPVLLLNLKFALRGLSSSGVLSSGSQQLLSGVLSLSKIQSPYQTGAGLSWMKWLSFLWVHPHCKVSKLMSIGMRLETLLGSVA